MRLGSCFAVLVIILLCFQGFGLVFGVNNTSLVSVSSSNNQSNGVSLDSSLSADGRFVTFASVGDNLVSNDTNGVCDIFIRDLDLNQTEIVSVDNNGSFIGGESPSVNGNGRYVTFLSSVYDDLTGNNFLQVFVRDRSLKTTKIISLNSTGSLAGNNCWNPVISGDGLFVAFSSTATNLVNSIGDVVSNVFVYDMAKNTLEKITRSVSGGSANSDSDSASISGDGRYISYTSLANNLVVDDTNNFWDVFVFDRLKNTTTRVSVDSDGHEANYDSWGSSISADGSLVAFTSKANNLVSNDNNNFRDVFVRDLVNNITVRASETSDGESVDLESLYPCISPEGRYVAFNSAYPDIVAAKTSTPTGYLYSTNNSGLASTLVSDDLKYYRDVFVKDLYTGDIWKISKPLTGIEANSDSYEPSISINGTRVSYSSWASDLVNDDNNNYQDIFIWKTTNNNTTPTTTIPEFNITGKLSPITTQIGQTIKISVLTSTLARSITAWIKNTKINLKPVNGYWEATYKIPTGSSIGQQTLILKGIGANNLTANSTLYFTVITKTTTPPTKPPTVIKKPVVVKKVTKPVPKTTKKVSTTQSTANKAVKAGVVAKSQNKIKDTTISNFWDYFIKSWQVNNKGSVYGASVVILNNPFNPLSNTFYSWDKFIQAAQKAYKSGNIWDFFNYQFYHIYGYKNLDKIWGGKNIKTLMDVLFEVDSKGNVSIGGMLLLLLYLVPVGGEAAILAKMGLSKAGIKILTSIFGKTGAKTIQKATTEILTKFNAYLIKPIVSKIPWLKNLDLKGVWSGLVKFSNLVNLNAKSWNNLLKTVYGNKLNFLRKLDPKGKVKASEIPHVLDLAKSIIEGPISVIKWVAGVFKDATPLAIKKLIHYSPLRMKKLSKLEKLANNKTYRSIQKKLAPLIKRYLERSGVVAAFKKLNNGWNSFTKKTGKTIKKINKESKKVNKQGLKNYVKNKLKSGIKKVKNHPLTKKIVKEYKKAKKQGGKRYLYKKVKSYIKKAKKNPFVKKVVNGAKKLQKTFNNGLKKIGNIWNNIFHHK